MNRMLEWRLRDVCTQFTFYKTGKEHTFTSQIWAFIKRVDGFILDSGVLRALKMPNARILGSAYWISVWLLSVIAAICTILYFSMFNACTNSPSNKCNANRLEEGLYPFKASNRSTSDSIFTAAHWVQRQNMLLFSLEKLVHLFVFWIRLITHQLSRHITFCSSWFVTVTGSKTLACNLLIKS